MKNFLKKIKNDENREKIDFLLNNIPDNLIIANIYSTIRGPALLFVLKTDELDKFKNKERFLEYILELDVVYRASGYIGNRVFEEMKFYYNLDKKNKYNLIKNSVSETALIELKKESNNLYWLAMSALSNNDDFEKILKYCGDKSSWRQ